MTTTTTAHASSTTASNENTMGMLAHLLMIFTWWLGPLILFLVKKDEGFARGEAREALNFGITLTLAYIVCWVLTLVTLGILFFLPFLVLVAGLVFGILGCIAANKGQPYRYPVNLRLVK